MSLSTSAQSPATLRAIALFKFLQALALLGVSLAAFQLLRPDVAAFVQDWMRQLPIQREQTLMQQLARWSMRLLPHQVAGIGAGALLYALLFLIEGVGLWRQKVWAEWLTVIATSLLIPFELYEVFRRPTWVPELALAVNVLVVWLLVRQLRKQRTRVEPVSDAKPPGARP